MCVWVCDTYCKINNCLTKRPYIKCWSWSEKWFRSKILFTTNSDCSITFKISTKFCWFLLYVIIKSSSFSKTGSCNKTRKPMTDEKQKRDFPKSKVKGKRPNREFSSKKTLHHNIIRKSLTVEGNMLYPNTSYMHMLRFSNIYIYIYIYIRKKIRSSVNVFIYRNI